MNFYILDLFCGAGGFSAGLDQLKNFQTVVGCDFNKYAIKTFRQNFPKAIGIYGDILNPKIKKKIIKISKETGVNMIIGGPPCQGFSLKGKKLGFGDPRNFLFLEYLSIVKEIKPEVFIIENVKNILYAENGYFKDQIVKNFSSLGYIINYGVLNAKDFGVPQNRERAIIIGSLSKSINLPISKQQHIVTVRDAISDLAYLFSGEGEFESEYKNKPNSKYQQKLRGKKLYNHIATQHSSLTIKKLSLIPPEGDKTSLPKKYHGKQKFSTTWSRLQWDHISPTIDTRFDTPSNGRNSHPELNRAITAREAARIQSFRDDFIFYGSKSAIGKQIGNAVPPLLAKAIGEAIYDSYSQTKIIDDNYSLFLGNAYTIIEELKKNKITVNHIITDPPYNISKENNFYTLKSPRKGIDFGQWDKNFDLYSWIHGYTSILNKNGSVIIFCSYRYISHIIEELEKNNLLVKDILIWRKKNPMPRNIERRYIQDMEFAIWAIKRGAKWTFNKPQDIPYLRSVYETSTVSGKEKTGHPTQKSLKLMEAIIQIHTNPGDIVIDPFMGSGTTGVACLKNNRKFIGIELSKEYFDIAVERIQNSQRTLFR